MTKVQKKTIDSQLIASCRGGDEKAFKELFDQYFHPLYFYALKFIPDRSSAEEIVMDVLLNIWQKRHLLNEELPFPPYLYRSVRNRVTDHLRRRHDRLVALDGVCHEPASTWIADGRVLYKELEHIYRSGIEKLPPRKKLILTMSREKGNSYQQIADKLRISKNTVENHMVAAIRQLRQHVGGRV
jgi:RNA polymerase sigma-70 factor (ECF subfamily)